MGKVDVYRFVVLVAFIVIIAYIPLFLSENTMNMFIREDRIYETLSPIYLAVASLMFGFAFYRARDRFQFKDHGLLKLSFLGLSAVFFVAAMEEISWGQRIFHFSTPNVVEEANAQHEFTFHNLRLFQGRDAVVPLDFDQLSAAFALTLGFLIPVAATFIRVLKAFLISWFPVLPVQFSPVFALNYIIQKLTVRSLPLYPELYHNTTRKIPAAIHEIREHNYDLLLMVAAIFFVILQLDKPDRTRDDLSRLETK